MKRATGAVTKGPWRKGVSPPAEWQTQFIMLAPTAYLDPKEGTIWRFDIRGGKRTVRTLDWEYFDLRDNLRTCVHYDCCDCHDGCTEEYWRDTQG